MSEELIKKWRVHKSIETSATEIVTHCFKYLVDGEFRYYKLEVNEEDLWPFGPDNPFHEKNWVRFRPVKKAKEWHHILYKKDAIDQQICRELGLQLEEDYEDMMRPIEVGGDPYLSPWH